MSKRRSRHNKQNECFTDRRGNRFFHQTELRPLHNEDVPVNNTVANLRESLESKDMAENRVLQQRLFKTDLYASLLNEGAQLPTGLPMRVERRPDCSRREKELWYGDTKKNGRGGKFVAGSYEDDIEDWERLQSNLDHLARVQEEKKARAKFERKIQKERERHAREASNVEEGIRQGLLHIALTPGLISEVIIGTTVTRPTPMQKQTLKSTPRSRYHEDDRKTFRNDDDSTSTEESEDEFQYREDGIRYQM